jgi:hypothetical protein
MAPKTKAAQSRLSNLASKAISCPGPSDDGDPLTGQSFPTHRGNISRKVTVEDWPESDSEAEGHEFANFFPGNSLPFDPESCEDLFDFDGLSHGPAEEDNSDLSDSDIDLNEEGEFAEINEDAKLLLFSETLQQAQIDAAEGQRRRWKEKKGLATLATQTERNGPMQ